MAATERDFSDFYLGDNVYELANGLVPEIAEKLEVDIAGEPNSDDLQAIMQKVGTNKVLRANEEVTAIDRDEMADLVERSGVQKRLHRSLWSPRIEPDTDMNKAYPNRVLAFGGVANWQDRTAALILREGYAPVHLLGGERVMNTATETSNRNIEQVHETFGRYPTEAEYAGSVILPRLVKSDIEALVTAYPTQNGDEIIAKFFEQNPSLLEQRLLVARTANAGVIVALQVRAVARTLNQDFDTDETNPQMFVMTDGFPVAHTDEQEAAPAQYQKPATALRQVVLVAKKLHEEVL